MSNIKIYDVEHVPTGSQIRVQIDFDFIGKIENSDGTYKDLSVMDAITDMVHFWAGSYERIEDNDGDIVNTFLKSLCETVSRCLSNLNFNLLGVIDNLKDSEGWYALDGSFGIKLLSIDEPDFTTQSNYEIVEL